MFLYYLLISLAASVVGAISGIGGGVIIKPLMDILSPFNAKVIGFLSGNTVLAMSTVTLIRNRRNAIPLDRKVSTLLATGGIAGGLAGKYIFDFLRLFFGNDYVIGAIQSICLVLLCFGVMLFTILKSRIPSIKQQSIAASLLIGLLLGGLASFLGIGGGPMNLAILYLFFSMDSRTAALNSIYIIFFSQLANLIFTIASGKVPAFSPLILALMITGGIGGGILGSHISRKITNKHVDYIFGVVMIVIISISLYNFSNNITDLA